LSLEVKHRVPSLEAVETALMASGGRELGAEVQQDTYFNVREGTLKLREGGMETYLIYCERDLKDGIWENRSLLHTIRPPEVSDSINQLNQLARVAGFVAMDLSELTAGEVEDDRLANSATRAVHVAKGIQDVGYVLRSGRQDSSTLQGVLQAVLGVRCSVEKKRAKWSLGPVKVSLDDVDALGGFAEIEAHLGGKSEPREVAASIVKAERSLGLDMRKREHNCYADLVRPGYYGSRHE
jgi:adenylate cyclase class IV